MTNQTPESVIAEVIEYHADAIGSHYDGCYKHHAVCLAVKLRDMLREPGVSDAATGESEKRAWAIASHLERDRELIKAERDAAVAAIERVRALHSKSDYDGGICLDCEKPWPCPTALALGLNEGDER